MPDTRNQATVVIPAYNEVFLFERCLHSVLGQASVQVEVVVVDDSTTNEISLSVKRIDAGARVRYLEGARSGNAVDNWNRGLDAATSPWVILMHQDEYFVSKDSLREFLEHGERAGKPVVIGTCRVVSVVRASAFGVVSRAAAIFAMPAWTLLAVNWIGPTACVLFRSDLRMRLDPSLKYLVDVDFYFRLLSRQGRPSVTEHPVIASLGHHSAQISSTWDYSRESAEFAKLSRRVRDEDGRVAYIAVRLARSLRRLLHDIRRAVWAE